MRLMSRLHGSLIREPMGWLLCGGVRSVVLGQYARVRRGAPISRPVVPSPPAVWRHQQVFTWLWDPSALKLSRSFHVQVYSRWRRRGSIPSCTWVEEAPRPMHAGPPQGLNTRRLTSTSLYESFNADTMQRQSTSKHTWEYISFSQSGFLASSNSYNFWSCKENVTSKFLFATVFLISKDSFMVEHLFFTTGLQLLFSLANPDPVSTPNVQ